MKKPIFIFLAFILMATIFTACGGRGGIPDGTYVPEAELGAAYTSLEFKGGKVSVGMVGGLMSTTVNYTYKDGKLSFEVQGMSVDLPCEVKENAIVLGGVEYKKK